MTGFRSSSTAVDTAQASTNGHHSAPGVRTPLSTRHRPKGYAALLVALTVGFAALGYYFYAQSGSKVPVVMARSDIAVGHTIQSADLTTVELSGGVTAVAGNHLDSLIGQTARVEILPGTPVQRAMVSTASPLSASQSLVGVAAGPGQIPSSGLVPGDKVQVLRLPDKGASAAQAPTAATAVLADSVTVYDVRANQSTAGGSLLTLMVPKQAAFGIESASNAGLIALVQVGR